MSARFVDPTGTESAKIATSRVGSTRARMVISRLAPIPPNAVPVSSPANANAAAPSVSSATTTNRSVPAAGTAAMVTNGATATTATVVASISSGAVRNTSLVPRGVMGCLRASLRRSRHGCSTPAPARPSNRARIWRITPTSNGDPRPATRAIIATTQCARSQLTTRHGPALTGSPPAGSARHTRQRSRSRGRGARCRWPTAARLGPRPAPRRGPGGRGGARRGRVPAAGS